MSSAKTIAKNTGYLFSQRILEKLLSFFLVIVITRYLGSQGFGVYSFAFAFIGLFIMFSHFGLTTYIFREIAKDKTKAKKLADNVFTLKLFLLAAVYIIVTIVAWNVPKTREIMLFFLLVMLHEVFTTLNTLISVIFQAYERNEYNVYSSIIDKGLALLFGALVLINGYGLYGLILALIAAKIISLIFRYTIVYKKFVKISFEFDLKFWKTLVKHSFPFFLTRVFEVVYYETDKVMLTLIKNSYRITGWYSAASTLVAALTFIPTGIINATFPAMSRFYHKNSEDFLKLLYKKTFYYLLLIGLPISIGISLLSQRLIFFIYREQFIESGIVLKILSWSLIFIFINHAMGYLLNSINKQHLFTISTTICAISNVFINFILIPQFSYVGAAFATIAAQFINFCLLYYFTAKNDYAINLVQMSYKPIIAGICMGVSVIYLAFLPVVYIIPIAAIVYLTILVTIRGFGKEEINLIKSFLSTKKERRQ